MISLSQLKTNRRQSTRLRSDRSTRGHKLLGLPNLKSIKFGVGLQLTFFVFVTLIMLFLISNVSKNSDLETHADSKPGTVKILTNFNLVKTTNQSDSFVVKELLPLNSSVQASNPNP